MVRLGCGPQNTSFARMSKPSASSGTLCLSRSSAHSALEPPKRPKASSNSWQTGSVRASSLVVFLTPLLARKHMDVPGVLRRLHCSPTAEAISFVTGRRQEPSLQPGSLDLSSRKGCDGFRLRLESQKPLMRSADHGETPTVRSLQLPVAQTGGGATSRRQPWRPLPRLRKEGPGGKGQQRSIFRSSGSPPPPLLLPQVSLDSETLRPRTNLLALMHTLPL